MRAKAVKSNIVLKAMGVNMNELRKQDPAQQLAMAREKGFDAFVDVLTTTQDVDSDSDSSVDEEVKARRHKQNVLRGTAKPSAWSAIKEHSVAPKVSKPGSQWQTLMDDTWSEFMTTIKARQESKSEAKMFRIKDALYTEEEVTEWLLDADLEARRNGYFGMPPPSKRVIKRIVRSIVDSKVQQFDAADSDEEEEQDEQDEIVEAARDIKAAAVGKMQRFVRREMGWQNQTIAWQKSVTEAVARMEEELVMTHQVMTDLAKRGGGDAGAASDPAVRERMWATMQAKQALREALQNTPSAGRGGAALDADAADPELDDADDAAAAAPDVARGSLRDRWKAASSGATPEARAAVWPTSREAPSPGGPLPAAARAALDRARRTAPARGNPAPSPTSPPPPPPASAPRPPPPCVGTEPAKRRRRPRRRGSSPTTSDETAPVARECRTDRRPDRLSVGRARRANRHQKKKKKKKKPKKADETDETDPRFRTRSLWDVFGVETLFRARARRADPARDARRVAVALSLTHTPPSVLTRSSERMRRGRGGWG